MLVNRPILNVVFRCYSVHSTGDGPPTAVHMPQDALTGPGIPHQARAFNTLMHGEVIITL